ncbi:uncharacterized protein At5g65660-like [Lotus japonicus]|uniref:uncharacterized protein At5g65660-like n=1 Tax=Lotus japonicus TaxID=34305 RepID=UPI00258413E4|nr:uncharacterized protein At5g65660-like [Lotus japonicus]
MDSQDISPSHVDASRPTLGFPLGTALLLIIIFSLSGIFSCCYHWDKLRSLRHQSFSDLEAAANSSSSPSNSKLKPHSKVEGSSNSQKSLTVLMPGDEVPKFIAMPCPCQTWRQENIIVTVEKPEPPPKPSLLPVPFY